MKRITMISIALTILFLLMATALPHSAYAQGNMEYEFAFAVHSINDDQYIRHVGPDLSADTLYGHEYYVLYLTIHNNSGKVQNYSKAVLSVDDHSYTWEDLTVNKAFSLRLSRDAMKMISAGKHVCTLQLDGNLVHSNTFVMQRDWGSLMKLPTQEQINRYNPEGQRSPYISFRTGFGSCGGYTEYSVDVHTDHLPYGTYLCSIDWWMDLSSLEKNYTKVWADYGGAGGGYCGLQVWDDGTRGVIMTLWDTFCEDQFGNVSQIKAKVLYPENAADTDHNNSSEGSFVHYSYPYDWKAGKGYRFLLQQSNGNNGNVLMTLWIGDIEAGAWTKLFCFDTGIQDIWIRSTGGFLENYIVKTSGEVRTMEFRNIRARMRNSGRWEDAESVTYSINASVGTSSYQGSYNFGQDSRSCWIITSGIPGLNQPNSNTGPYPVPQTREFMPELPKMTEEYTLVDPVSAPAAEEYPSDEQELQIEEWWLENAEPQIEEVKPAAEENDNSWCTSAAPEPPEEYDEFLRSGDWVLDLAWADMDYEDLLFWPSQWCVYDVDRNGTQELIVQFNGFWLIYTSRNGQIRLVSTGALTRDMAVSVCPELGIVRFDGGHTSWSFTCFVRIINGTEQARFERDKEDPYYLGFTAAEVDPSLEGAYFQLEQNDVCGIEIYA